MELRVLQYFLAVVREQSILGAAESLHLSQPTLSRQLRDLEEELGKQLFVRSNRRITLTEEGIILRKRAEEIMSLVHKAESEIALYDETIAGDITVGAGETEGMRHLVRAAKAVQQEHPLVHFHVISGDKTTVLEELDRGLLDFALVFNQIDHTKYEAVELPTEDRFGVLMRRDDPMAQKESVRREELWGKPLIVSRQAFSEGRFLAVPIAQLNIVATYNLLYNGSLMAEEGLGYVIGFDHIINVSGNSELCYRPIEGSTPVRMFLIWKKYQVLTKAAEKFLEQIRKLKK